MKLLINTAHQRFGGAIQVALSFIHECKAISGHEYHVIVGQGLKNRLHISDFPSNFKFYDLDLGVIKLRNLLNIQRKLESLEKEIQPDCIISTTGPTYFKSQTPQVIGFNLPLYIYPESPFLSTLSKWKRLRLFLKKKLHVFYFKRDAIAYVVQTYDVNQRVRKLLNNLNVYTVSNTYNHYYEKPIILAPKLPKKRKEEFRLLTISAWYPHKNLDIIPKIAEIFKNRKISNVRFVLTLNQADFEKIVPDDMRDVILNVGPVEPKDCPSLYKECDAMFLPTLAECFSASYPEAMIMEKPIITTSLGFAKSICGEAALYFEPLNPIDAALKISELINNSDMQSDLVDKGMKQLKEFNSPNERAHKYIQICKSLSLNKK